MSRDPALGAKAMVALHADLGVRPLFAAVGAYVVVGHVTESSGRGATVGQRSGPRAERGDRLLNDGIKKCLRDDVAGERRSGDDVVRPGRLAGWIVNRNQCAVLIYPVVKVAIVHFRRGYRTYEATRPIPVSESLIAPEEEGAVLAVVDFGNPHRTSRGRAEIVLLISGSRNATPVIKQVVGVERLVAHEVISRAVNGIGAGL